MEWRPKIKGFFFLILCWNTLNKYHVKRWQSVLWNILKWRCTSSKRRMNVVLCSFIFGYLFKFYTVVIANLFIFFMFSYVLYCVQRQQIIEKEKMWDNLWSMQIMNGTVDAFDEFFHEFEDKILNKNCIISKK